MKKLVSKYKYKKLGDLAVAAPIIPIEITPPVQNPTKTISCEGILDTGCDCTLVPFEIISKLSLRSRPDIAGEQVEVTMGMQKVVVVSFYGGIIFDGNLHLMKFLGCESIYTKGYILIGRDILNDYTIKCNGPQQTVSISRRRILQNKIKN